jgi:hypothetical protein
MMKKIKVFLYSILAMGSALVAWALYFLADHVAKFSDAWDKGADHYHNKVMERI